MDPALLKGTKSLVELLEREINPPVSENAFSVGETVEHKVLGQGVIINIDAKRGFCYVDFGDKRINLKSTLLHKINNERTENKDDEIEKKDDTGKTEGCEKEDKKNGGDGILKRIMAKLNKSIK
jgi:hypothetical protein